ncbi:MAG TPA: APC family permease [Candidatus Binataceae bacterium]|jgi:APA family basic amino acid/polyamine antiporter|nr:APC family permease [Candidatus Binataceae bacterium]
MAEEQPKMVPTLGLTGVTVNAMALIAPGAFLWITFVVQAGYAYPSGIAMWAGIFGALMLAYATAISYSELAKLFPGAGSSYLFAEQAFLNTTHAYRFARIAKFVIGWASHLYYWVYPGVMVATMGVMVGYIIGSVAPSTMNASVPGPVFMALIAVIFSFFVAYIAFQGVTGSTNVNIAINAIQIVALLFFSALAIAYRMGHPAGSMGLALDGTMKKLSYSLAGATPAHPNGLSVILPHNFNAMMLQATIAILLLVGFESVTALGEEAKNPKKDIPRGVLLSLTIQCLFCYLIEYFAANYFLNSAYSLADAKGSAAPIGDMLVILGNSMLGGHGQAFMLIEAFTVFLALIGTTLSCINTGARVTYAMGRDEEVPEHFGILHGDNLTPHRAIWVLATISAVLGAYAALYFFAGAAAPDDKTIATLPHNIWYAIGMTSNASLSALPNGLQLVTLVSNFGTFMLYGLTNIVCIVAFREHDDFHGMKHMVIPIFGAVANFACMAFYIIGPIEGLGSVKEPLMAVAISVIWGLYGAIYFVRNSRKKGKETMVIAKTA